MTSTEPQTEQRAPTLPAGAGRTGPNPFVVVAVAFALGFLLAKVMDWRSHAHPRD